MSKIHKFKAAHFHAVIGRDGKMYCRDLCDCGCQDYKYEVNEGDTLISKIAVHLFGELKNIKIIARRFVAHPNRSVTLSGVEMVTYNEAEHNNPPSE